MDDVHKRLDTLEKRLQQIEDHLGMTCLPPPAEEPRFTFSPPATPEPPDASPKHRGNPVTGLLGWCGAMLLVLAAAYLIKLAVDTGWLTPLRQLALAVLGAGSLIATGLALRRNDRGYAGLLPAAGMVILFLTLYAAHLHYHLIGPLPTGAGILVVCVGSLLLCRLFASDLYALFAVLGSYSAPFLLHSGSRDLGRIALFYGAWGIGFGLFSLWTGRRRYYLAALYLGLLGFQLLWYIVAPLHWRTLGLVQAGQATLFATWTAAFTLRHRRPLDIPAALFHLPAAALFYLFQFSVLGSHLPRLTAWLALASILPFWILFLVPRLALRVPLPGGRLLVSFYAAMALFHSGYLVLLPTRWQPWAGLLAVPLAACWLRWPHHSKSGDWPLLAGLGSVWSVNFLAAIANRHLPVVPARPLLTSAFTVTLYAGYLFARQGQSRLPHLGIALLSLGHLAAMAAASQIFDSRLAISLAWGVLALACLALAGIRRDRLLGQSSLLVFALSAVKLVFFDLDRAAPLMRIGCLVVVGITFYAGGWLYRRFVILQHID